MVCREPVHVGDAEMTMLLRHTVRLAVEDADAVAEDNVAEDPQHAGAAEVHTRETTTEPVANKAMNQNMRRRTTSNIC